MKKIPLTKGRFTVVDDEDFPLLSQHKWYCMTSTPSGYAARGTGSNGSLILMHRQIMETPKGMECDHINMDGLDNRRENLRNCTSSQNKMNRGPQKNNALGYKGISKIPSGKYRAKIQIDGKQVHLGYFESVQQAATAYDHAAEKYHHQFAHPNRSTK